MLFLLGYLENCYLVGELAFGGDRGDKNLLGEESTGDNFFRWGENEQTFGWCGGDSPQSPSTYMLFISNIHKQSTNIVHNSIHSLYGYIVYIHIKYLHKLYISIVYIDSLHT